MSIDTAATPQRPQGASARPPPPRRPRRMRLLIGAAILGVLVVAALLAVNGQLRRSVETTTTIDGEVHHVVVDGSAGDLHVSGADGAPQLTVAEDRPFWAATAGQLPAPAAAQEATPPAPSQLTPAALEVFLDDVMAEHFDRFDLAGASVTVVKDGEVRVSKGYGHADVAAGTPVEADTTIFPTASVAKLFTWTAIMQLVEQGQLDLDGEVNSYLSGFQIPDNFDEPVRVWHLLSHTAGFEDKPMSLASLPEDLTDLETALIRDMPAQDWEPGRYTAYNNYSTGLAGYLVAEVSGMSWEDYLDRNILRPLGMIHSSTRQPTPENLQPGMTKVYTTSVHGKHSEAPYEIVALAPFGGMVSTTDDMGSFMLAHLQQGRLGEVRILEEATARRMHSQLFSHDPRLAGNAHGFWESVEHGQRVLSHGGDHNTSMTGLWLMPDHDLGLYVAYNSDWGAEARRELWAAFLDHGFPTEASASVQPATTQADFERFTGTYGGNRISSTTPGKLFKLVVSLTVAAQDGHLVTDMAGYEAQRWLPAGDNEFVAVDGHARMVFSDDGARPSHVFFNGPSLTAYHPMGAFARTSWYDRAGLHGGLLAASLLVILSALVLWPVLTIVRRRKQTSTPNGGTGARWWAAATGGLYLLFIVLFVVTLLDYYALEFGAPPLLVAALIVGIGAAILSVGAVVHAILAWRNRHWSVAGRVHYTLVALAFVTLAWQLNHWNLLGFQV
jgi:CubicO group peptidase (beta-lactamase class C family)